MTKGIRVEAGRDWLGELRAVEGEAAFTALATQIAEEAPWFQHEVYRIAKDFGGDEWEDWAKGIFILPQTQPGVAEPDPLLAEFRAGSAARKRKLDQYFAEMKAAEAAEPEGEEFKEAAEGKPDAAALILPPGTALVPAEEVPAEPFIFPDDIKELNRKHAVISNVGGKCVVMEWVPSVITPGAKEISYQTFTSFKERYANRHVEYKLPTGRIDREPLASAWLANEHRRQYEGVDLVPGGKPVLPGGVLNLWRGWGVEPRPGDWSLMRRHVEEVLAAGDQRFADYLIRWNAWKFQNAGAPCETAIVLRGGKGSGKGVFGYALMLIYGPHGLQIFSSGHLCGKHNAHLQNKLFLFLDEAMWGGDRAAESVLKGMITEKWIMIEPKNVNAFPWNNRLGVLMSANAKWVVPASHDERRYAVNNICERWKQNKVYFGPLFAEVQNGGAAAMLYDLLTLDLDGWHPRDAIPQTSALVEQKMLSLEGPEQWWANMLGNGVHPKANANPPKAKQLNPRWVLSKTLLKACQDYSPRNRYLTETEFGRFLNDMDCEHKSNGSAWGWIFPPLAEARQAWLARVGGSWEFENPELEKWVGEDAA